MKEALRPQHCTGGAGMCYLLMTIFMGFRERTVAGAKWKNKGQQEISVPVSLHHI